MTSLLYAMGVRDIGVLRVEREFAFRGLGVTSLSWEGSMIDSTMLCEER